MNKTNEQKTKEIAEMYKKAQAIGENPSAGVEQSVMHLMGSMQRFSQVLEYLDGTMRLLAKTSDINQLTDRLIVRLLIEKGIFTEEEFEQKYKTEVIETYKEMEANAKEEMKKRMEEQMNIEAQETEAVTEAAENIIKLNTKKE
jgi:hypothetical protein